MTTPSPRHPSVLGRRSQMLEPEPLAESRALWQELVALLELESIFAQLPEDDS